MSLTKAARFLAFSFSLAACTSTPTRPTQTGTAGTFDLDAVSIVHAACP